MKTKTQIKKWILENCTNANGIIDLSNLDFGDKIVILSNLKAKEIYNNSQVANIIYNNKQKSDEINNWLQKAKKINNRYQKAKEIIDNSNQKAKKIYVAKWGI